jgi:hypothetical protein
MKDSKGSAMTTSFETPSTSMVDQRDHHLEQKMAASPLGQGSPTARRKQNPFELAKDCWDTYMYEINGAGLAWKFERFPSSQDRQAFSETFRKCHLSEDLERPDLLRLRIENFRNYTQALSTFVGPENRVVENGWDGRNITREIDTALIAKYQEFIKALDKYHASVVQLARIPGASDADVMSRAWEVSQVVERHSASDDLRSGTPRCYLETFMHQQTKVSQSKQSYEGMIGWLGNLARDEFNTDKPGNKQSLTNYLSRPPSSASETKTNLPELPISNAKLHGPSPTHSRAGRRGP